MCNTGSWEGIDCLSYVVNRKSQGKAQLTHERRKSGSGHGSVGGAIRARETKRFFASVSTLLLEWEPEVKICNKLFLSGVDRVWNEVYSSSPAKQRGMISRKDQRWEKVGIGIRRPRFADLDWIGKELSTGTISIHQDTPDNLQSSCV